MSWDEKWARAAGRSVRNEGERSRISSPNEVLAGLRPLRKVKGIENRAKEHQLLDSGNNIGRSAVITEEGVTTADGVSVLNIVSDDSKGTVVSVTLTVDQGRTLPGLPIVPPEEPFMNNPLGARARIQWGNSGHQVEAIVDYLQGCTISMACSFLRVNAFMMPGQNGASLGDLTVGAFVNYLPVSGANAQLTMQPNSGAEPLGDTNRNLPLPSGNVMTFRVPTFAKTLTVYRESETFGPGNTAANAVKVRMRGRGGGVGGVEIRSRNESWGSPMPLPNALRHIWIENIDTIDIDRLSLVFGLQI